MAPPTATTAITRRNTFAPSGLLTIGSRPTRSFSPHSGRENRAWIEKTAGFALVPHAVLYLRADVPDLISRVVVGRGAFDFWESGMDLRFGRNMFDSFVRYQSRLIRVFDSLAAPYNFQVIDASRPPVEVFESLKASVARVFDGDEKPATNLRKSVRPAHPSGSFRAAAVRRKP